MVSVFMNVGLTKEHLQTVSFSFIFQTELFHKQDKKMETTQDTDKEAEMSQETGKEEEMEQDTEVKAGIPTRDQYPCIKEI